MLFFFSSRRRHTRSKRDWSSDVCSSDLLSNQTDHTSRMITRLPSKLDQWDFVDAINRLTYQVETLQWRMSDAVPNSKRGLTYMAAVSQLGQDRKSTRLNSSHVSISYAVFCLKKKKT